MFLMRSQRAYSHFLLPFAILTTQPKQQDDNNYHDAVARGQLDG
jgi:hypothetical protein